MRAATDPAHRRTSTLLAATALLAAACAHGPERSVTSANLAAVRACGSAYASDAALEHAPDGDAPDNPYAICYQDLRAEQTLVGSVALYTPEASAIAAPDDPQDRYIGVSDALPEGTVVRVTRMDDGRSVIVVVREVEQQLPRTTLLALSEDAGRWLDIQDRPLVSAQVEVLLSPEEHLD